MPVQLIGHAHHARLQLLLHLFHLHVKRLDLQAVVRLQLGTLHLQCNKYQFT